MFITNYQYRLQIAAILSILNIPIAFWRAANLGALFTNMDNFNPSIDK